MRYLRPNALPRFSFAQKRYYAAFNDAVSLTFEQAAHIVRAPENLGGCRKISLAVHDWPKWDHNSKDHSAACHAAFSHILGALDSSVAVDVVSIEPMDLLALPLRHISSSGEHKRFGRERTPSAILKELGIDSKCNEFCHWTLQDFPKVEIRDPSIDHIIQEAWRYRDDWNSWITLVANSMNPKYKSFAYLADFHSRDLQQQDNGSPLIDFGPYGGGYHRHSAAAQDIDSLSIEFLEDFIQNAAHFSSNEWRPGMYAEQVKEKGMSHSTIGEGSLQGEAVAKICVTDFPKSWSKEKRLETLQRVAADVLHCEDDEELEYSDDADFVQKRKKKKPDSEEST
ncbi:hypothetical protein K402DRAFT_405489 [Aulographum hederae CBS 113979]|uniref:Uncharacterized protein n=1 Tax=Aulographum hederae CBS 113979 TaxID=1176131 RepID=A0A6G1GVM6_9PEZI|nr:hypothetical protein K402DRAFT_405489 [Aulographum hederae CBS 113979]